MKFELEEGLEILTKTPDVFRSLLAGLSTSWLDGGEGPDTWSPAEVVGHLIHGEAGWIPRTRIILGRERPTDFELLDRLARGSGPVGKTIDGLLDEFEILRRSSLADLEGLELTPADFAREGNHPEFGTVTLGQLLATWVVHDLGHLFQTVRAMARQYEVEVGPWGKYLGVLRKSK